jgi:hypothetical protein
MRLAFCLKLGYHESPLLRCAHFMEAGSAAIVRAVLGYEVRIRWLCWPFVRRYRTAVDAERWTTGPRDDEGERSE